MSAPKCITLHRDYRLQQVFSQHASISVYSYKNSTLSLIPIVLDEIKDGPVAVKVLYERVKPSLKDATDFISVMDCLYALRATDLNDEGEVFICL